MNFDKVIDTLRKFWVAHSPTVFTFLVVFLAINYYVLPKGQVIDLGSTWRSAKSAIDGTVNEMGIQLERGYVLAVLLYLGLVAIEWLSGLVASLPGLRIRTWFRISNRFIAEDAGRILGAGAHLYETERRLMDLLEKFRRGMSERNERSGFDWLAERAALWQRYFGLAVLVSIGLLGWWTSGATGAVSSERIVQLALVVAIFAAAARWRASVLLFRKDEWEMNAALRAYERDMPRLRDTTDRGRARGRAFARSIEYRRSLDRHPTLMIMRLSSRLKFLMSHSLFNRLQGLLNVPRYWESPDWRVFASAEMRRHDEEQVAYTALNAEVFEKRFASLLECRGSGLFILADRRLGLAPASGGSGESYCIASRDYDGHTLTLRFLRSGHDPTEFGEFWAKEKEGRFACLIDLGEFPVERIAQCEWPTEARVPWLGSKVIDDLRKWAAESSTTLRARARAIPGHAYLWVSEVSETANAVVGFQCFAIESRPDCVLVAFRILAVTGTESIAPKVLPWWRPRAWTHVLKAPPEQRAGPP